MDPTSYSLLADELKTKLQKRLKIILSEEVEDPVLVAVETPESPQTERSKIQNHSDESTSATGTGTIKSPNATGDRYEPAKLIHLTVDDTQSDYPQKTATDLMSKETQRTGGSFLRYEQPTDLRILFAELDVQLKKRSPACSYVKEDTEQLADESTSVLEVSKDETLVCPTPLSSLERGETFEDLKGIVDTTGNTDEPQLCNLASQLTREAFPGRPERAKDDRAGHTSEATTADVQETSRATVFQQIFRRPKRKDAIRRKTECSQKLELTADEDKSVGKKTKSDERRNSYGSLPPGPQRQNSCVLSTQTENQETEPQDPKTDANPDRQSNKRAKNRERSKTVFSISRTPKTLSSDSECEEKPSKRVNSFMNLFRKPRRKKANQENCSMITNTYMHFEDQDIIEGMKSDKQTSEETLEQMQERFVEQPANVEKIPINTTINCKRRQSKRRREQKLRLEPRPPAMIRMETEISDDDLIDTLVEGARGADQYTDTENDTKKQADEENTPPIPDRTDEDISPPPIPPRRQASLAEPLLPPKPKSFNLTLPHPNNPEILPGKEDVHPEERKASLPQTCNIYYNLLPSGPANSLPDLSEYAPELPPKTKTSVWSRTLTHDYPYFLPNQPQIQLTNFRPVSVYHDVPSSMTPRSENDLTELSSLACVSEDTVNATAYSSGNSSRSTSEEGSTMNWIGGNGLEETLTDVIPPLPPKMSARGLPRPESPNEYNSPRRHEACLDDENDYDFVMSCSELPKITREMLIEHGLERMVLTNVPGSSPDTLY